jgi:hypothetical protein
MFPEDEREFTRVLERGVWVDAGFQDPTRVVMKSSVFV